MPELTLPEELNRLNKILTKLSARQSFGRSFLTGIFTGLGSVVGATLVVALIVFLLSKIEFIPLIGAWLSRLIEQIITNLPQK